MFYFGIFVSSGALAFLLLRLWLVIEVFKAQSSATITIAPIFLIGPPLCFAVLVTLLSCV